MIHRRAFLRGLFAAPAIVAASSLMPVRGIILPQPKTFRIKEMVITGLDQWGNPIEEIIRYVVREDSRIVRLDGYEYKIRT